MAINKTEFINRIAEKGGMKKVEAEKAVDLFLETLIGCLMEDGTVKLYGFGRFEARTAKERIGRNPKSGETYVIPEHKKIKFTQGDALAKQING